MGGTLGPLVQEPNYPLAQRVRLSANFAVGFTLGALSTFALAAALSIFLVQPLFGATARTAIAAAGLALWLGLQVRALWANEMWFPLTLHRQTPQRYMLRFGAIRTAAIWGFDLGTAVSTFRVTGATWGALTLVLLGWSPAWIGLAYSAGFTAPLLMLIWSGRVPAREPERAAGDLDLLGLQRVPSQQATAGLLALGVLLFAVSLARG